MIRLIITIAFLIIVAVYTIVDLIIGFILSFNKNLLMFYHRVVAKAIMKIILFISGVELEISGIANLREFEKSGAGFIISNHRGFFDIIIGITLLRTNTSFVAKKELADIPLLGYWMNTLGTLSFDRSDMRAGAMMVINAIQKIKDGINIWLCPEGTRNKNSDEKSLLDFKHGSFKIPEKADSYILPIAFTGTNKVFEDHLPFIRSAIVKVNIGKMYKISELSENNKADVAVYSQNIVRGLLNG